MAHDGTGTIYITMEEFRAFVLKFAPDLDGAEFAFGVPRVSDENSDLEIDYAFSTECPPSSWGKTPPAVQQWNDLKKKEKEKKTNG